MDRAGTNVFGRGDQSDHPTRLLLMIEIIINTDNRCITVKDLVILVKPNKINSHRVQITYHCAAVVVRALPKPSLVSLNKATDSISKFPYYFLASKIESEITYLVS